MANTETSVAGKPSDARSGEGPFDPSAYAVAMPAQARARAAQRERPRRLAYRSLGIATLLILVWIPSVIIAAYGVSWDWFATTIPSEGWSRVSEWPWILGTLVVASYAFFYGLAASLATQNARGAYGPTIGAFYGLWVWLPLFLIYPGRERLGVWSDAAGIWAFLFIAGGATAYAGYVGSWATRHLELVKSWAA